MKHTATNLTTAVWPFLAARWRLDVPDKPVETSASPDISRRWHRPSVSPNSKLTTFVNNQPPTISKGLSSRVPSQSNIHYTITDNISNIQQAQLSPRQPSINCCTNYTNRLHISLTALSATVAFYPATCVVMYMHRSIQFNYKFCRTSNQRWQAQLSCNKHVMLSVA